MILKILYFTIDNLLIKILDFRSKSYSFGLKIIKITL